MSEYKHLIQALTRQPLTATELNGLIYMTPKCQVDYAPRHDVPYTFSHLRVIGETRTSSIDNIIKNIPEITTENDVPEFVSINQSFLQRPQNVDLVNINNDKYFRTATNCDENGYYINDHDYLGLPVLHEETEQKADYINADHTYAMRVHPSCLYIDLNQLESVQNRELQEIKAHICVYCSKIFPSKRSLMRHSASHRKLGTLMEPRENEIII